jgi:hypothetical protein
LQDFCHSQYLLKDEKSSFGQIWASITSDYHTTQRMPVKERTLWTKFSILDCKR